MRQKAMKKLGGCCSFIPETKVSLRGYPNYKYAAGSRSHRNNSFIYLCFENFLKDLN